MSTIASTFVPTLWAREGLWHLDQKLVFAQAPITNRDFEGEIARQGGTLHINRLGNVTVAAYDATVGLSDPSLLTADQRDLVIDQAESFNVFIDAVSAAKGAAVNMPMVMDRAAQALGVAVDSYVAAQITAGVASGNKLGSTGSPLDITTTSLYDGAYDTIVDLGTTLDNANVPSDNRWVVAAPAVINAIAKLPQFNSFGTDANRAVLTGGAGAIGEINGFQVFRSTNVTVGSGYTTITAGQQQAVTLAYGLPTTNMEVYSHNKFFGEALRGLALYGAKVLDGNAVAQAFVATS